MTHKTTPARHEASATTAEPPATVRNPLSDIADGELVRRFAETGDEAAFRELVQRYTPLVMGVALRTTHDQPGAEDVLQATLLVLVEKAASLQDPGEVSAWLHGVALRIARRLVDKRHRHREKPHPEESLIMDCGTTSDPFQRVCETRDHDVLGEELQRLPEKLRTPMVLRYLEDLTNQQVAERLGLKVTTIEGRLKRGKKELRRRLARRGVTLGAAMLVWNMTQQSVAATPVASLAQQAATTALAWETPTPSVAPPSESAISLARQETLAMSTLNTTAMGAVAGTLLLATGLLVAMSGANEGNASAAAAVPATVSAIDTLVPVSTDLSTAVAQASEFAAAEGNDDSPGAGTIDESKISNDAPPAGEKDSTAEAQIAGDHIRFKKPHGAIRYVDDATRTVWLNLGNADGMFLNLTFGVYDQNNDDDEQRGEDSKGSIEVVRVLGDHLCEARIVNERLDSPITTGDVVYSPTWTPFQVANGGTTSADTPQAADSARDREKEVRVFRLRQVQADSAAKVLRDLFESANPPTGGASDFVAPALSVDTRTNSVLASGEPESLQVIEAILLQMDQRLAVDGDLLERTLTQTTPRPNADLPPDESAETARDENEVRRIMAYPTQHVEPEEVAGMLDTLFPDTAEVHSSKPRFAVDQRQKMLIVHGTEQQHEQIQTLIEILDRPEPRRLPARQGLPAEERQTDAHTARRVRVFKPQRTTARNVAGAITDFFERAAATAGNADKDLLPKVSIDSRTNAVIVEASADQLELIGEMIAPWDNENAPRSHADSDSESVGSQPGPYVPLEHADAQRVARLIAAAIPNSPQESADGVSIDVQNSLLIIRGPREQVEFIRNLAAGLDQPPNANSEDEGALTAAVDGALQRAPDSRLDITQRSPAEQKLRRALRTPTVPEFDDMTLDKVLFVLAEQQEFQYFIDKAAFEEQGLALDDHPVTLNLQNSPTLRDDVTLGAVLELALRQASGDAGAFGDSKLAYFVKEGLLVITTRAVAHQTMQVHTYDLRPFEELSPEVTLDQIVTAIQTMTGEDTWTDQGGRGSLVQGGSILTIRQSPLVHREIEALLVLLLHAGEQARLDE